MVDASELGKIEDPQSEKELFEQRTKDIVALAKLFLKEASSADLEDDDFGIKIKNENSLITVISEYKSGNTYTVEFDQEGHISSFDFLYEGKPVDEEENESSKNPHLYSLIDNLLIFAEKNPEIYKDENKDKIDLIKKNEDLRQLKEQQQIERLRKLKEDQEQSKKAVEKYLASNGDPARLN